MPGSKLVVAVSGGVDSVALLHALVNPDRRLKIGDRGSELALLRSSALSPRASLIVAHFDHGIREESGEDAGFVKNLAKSYGLEFELGKANLGKDASEDKARQERYKFLRQVCKKHKASLVTAHHQDDLIETAVINLIRGTGWRGLASMLDISDLISVGSDDRPHTENQGLRAEDCQQNSSNRTNAKVKRLTSNVQILRPLLNCPKSAIVEYAKKHGLKWQEDSTNAETIYLRNYVRQKILRNNPELRADLLAHIKIATKLRKSIDNIFADLSLLGLNDRYDFIMYDPTIALEYLYRLMTNLSPDWHPRRLQLIRALHFIKTAKAGKRLEISRELTLQVSKRQFQFINASVYDKIAK